LPGRKLTPVSYLSVSCHFLDRQILDWVRVRVRVAVQELTVQDRTVQEPSGSRVEEL